MSCCCSKTWFFQTISWRPTKSSRENHLCWISLRPALPLCTAPKQHPSVGSQSAGISLNHISCWPLPSSSYLWLNVPNDQGNYASWDEDTSFTNFKFFHKQEQFQIQLALLHVQGEHQATNANACRFKKERERGGEGRGEGCIHLCVRVRWRRPNLKHQVFNILRRGV